MVMTVMVAKSSRNVQELASLVATNKMMPPAMETILSAANVFRDVCVRKASLKMNMASVPHWNLVLVTIQMILETLTKLLDQRAQTGAGIVPA